MGGSDPCSGCGHYYLHAPRCPTKATGRQHRPTACDSANGPAQWLASMDAKKENDRIVTQVLGEEDTP